MKKCKKSVPRLTWVARSDKLKASPKRLIGDAPMKRRRKWILAGLGAAALLAVTLLLLLPKSADGAELLQNGSLSALQENGQPLSWYQDAYNRAAGYTEYGYDPAGGPEGQGAVHITNLLANDARIAQAVAVEPGKTYCLSGYIRADAVGGWGANLSVEGIAVSSERVYQTDGEWQQVFLYGRTGKDQRTLTVFARLGGYSGEAEGEAWFSGLSFRQVSKVPKGFECVDFYRAPEKTASDGGFSFDLRHVLLLFFLSLLTAETVLAVRQKNLHGLLAVILAASVGNVLLFFAAGDGENLSLWQRPGLIAQYGLTALQLIALFLAFYVNRTGASPVPDAPPTPQPPRGKADGKDAALILLFTALYAVLAFVNLGSLTSPQTAFVFGESGEAVVFDLGETKTDFQMLYMGGIHTVDNGFSVEFSEDGETWHDAVSCTMAQGNLYQWFYVRDLAQYNGRAHSGRYVRLTANAAGLNLLEVIFRDGEGNPLPATVTDSLGRDASALLDEPDTLDGEPSWFNGMYFDEIYHARTAYEFLRGIPPYETTHPPLGKALMSLCVAVFGMTPFGWRFAGALAGVLMLPGMYLLGRLLFQKRRYAVLCCLLMAFDTLHFTQTRIATIDSFAVLFILWAFYFMLRWFFCDLFGKPLRKTLPLLFASGLFMGLAVANKWTGCFAGLGLAVIFFFGMGRRLPALRNTPDGGRKLLITLCSCLVFFVLIPAGIYWCSYIPYFSYSSEGVTLRGIVESARLMLGYHSQPGLGMDHPYYSPWYEWPLSAKPMYYASPDYPPAGYTYLISAFGNYLVWIPGGIAVLCVLTLVFFRFAARKGGDDRPFLLAVCFLAQFLPWTFVPRGTYIYHYFPSVPFLILCTAFVLELLENRLMLRAEDNSLSVRRADRLCLGFVIGYLVLTAAFFVFLFPAASGVTVPRGWINLIFRFYKLY